MTNKFENYKYPVSEIYGPVVQGEGALIGSPTYFVRLGGCDYRCSWCDSLYAVLPQYRKTWEKKTSEEILTEIQAQSSPVRHVTLSGGNPAIHPCGPLIALLHSAGYTVSIETQGTVGGEWLNELDWVVISPKPPSSGNITEYETLVKFLDKLSVGQLVAHRISVKIVVFTEEDFEYAKNIFQQLPPYYTERFMQVGTYQDPTTFSKEIILEDLATLQYRAMQDEILHNVRVLPQLHVLLHGLRRGI